MKKFIFLAVLCLLASASPVSAQLIIRNNGHAEIGTNPNENYIDTVTTLRIFGDSIQAAAGRITFGDSAYVAIGEKGTTNTDRLWLYGKKGVSICATLANVPTTIAYFDTELSNSFNFNTDVTSSGLFIQSDERYKENIEPVGETLNSLKNLEPVTYNLKNRGQNRSLQHSADKDSERYGFLAQNVQNVFPELVHTASEGYMSVDYIGLIPILVQSINELRAELAELKGEKQEDGDPMLAAQQAAQDEVVAGLKAAKLYQNAPNPWSSETVIRYSLPQSVAKADIYIYDMQGAQLKSIPAQGRGESQVTVTARDLKAGMYLYALVADGTLVDSKQMILTK
jgi:hypothetical protein